MIRFKAHHLALIIGLAASVPSYAANYCIKVNGGFGNGGSTFVGKGFAVPAAGACKTWTGYVKTASSVIANSTGSGCLSSNGIVLTLTILSTDPSYLGSGVIASDHIRICPAGSAGCPTGVGIGTDVGTFGGNAAKTTCTTALLNLPAVHD
jgi:hypothetical protein